MNINLPGRLIEFSQGGESWLAYRRGEDPMTSKELDNDEYEFFRAVEEGRQIRGGFGGYYVRADLTPGAMRAARYWAETLETSAGDDAAWEPEARNDLRAAQTMLKRLSAV
jgi:hypothetical protein